MELNYVIAEEDYIIFNLFTASKSKAIKKKRKSSWIYVTLTFVMLSGLFFESHNSVLGYSFLILGILTLLFYPLYLKSYYKKFYINYHCCPAKMGFKNAVTFNSQRLQAKNMLFQY